MPSLPRVVTVDPAGSIPQVVRSALDLMDRLVIQVDVPSGNDALEEIKRGDCRVVVTAWDLLDDDMKGWELAALLKRESQDTEIIILAEVEDTALDEETLQESPFIYLQRPVDGAKFLSALRAALDGEDVQAMLLASSTPTAANVADQFGPVPEMDLERAKTTINQLMVDLNASAILLATRDGRVLLEHGTVGYMDRDVLTQSLAPLILTNIHMKDLVGGNTTTIQFYDGDEYDVFVLSVGMHHFIAVIFDGTLGARQFGLVNRFGRRAAEDLIALLGAHAWIILPPEPKQEKAEAAPRRATKRKKTEEREETVELERARFATEEAAQPVAEVAPAEPEPEAPKLDPIEDLDPDALFSEDVDFDDNLFDLDNMEKLSSEGDQGGKLDWEEAMRLGLIDQS